MSLDANSENVYGEKITVEFKHPKELISQISQSGRLKINSIFGLFLEHIWNMTSTDKRFIF